MLDLGTDFLNDLPSRGARCPCCLRFTKIYHYALNAPMARILIWLVRDGPKHADGAGWVHVPSKGDRGILRKNAIGKLRIWGFAETKLSEDTKKKVSGMYRATPLGIAFAHRRSRAPSHAVVYNDKFLGYEGDAVDIVEALGKEFDYAALMEDAA